MSKIRNNLEKFIDRLFSFLKFRNFGEISSKLEQKYVNNILRTLFGESQPVSAGYTFSNLLVKVRVYPRRIIYVKMKGRGCGYIFTWRGKD
jgi:hypothetical protein